jgi:hypothetical protein
MDDAFLVSSGQPLADLYGVLQGLAWRQSTIMEALTKRLALK